MQRRQLGWLRAQLHFDLLDQFKVHLEQSAKDVDRHPQILLTMRKACGAQLRLVEPRFDVGDVIAGRRQALARDLLPDEIRRAIASATHDRESREHAFGEEQVRAPIRTRDLLPFGRGIWLAQQ